MEHEKHTPSVQGTSGPTPQASGPQQSAAGGIGGGLKHALRGSGYAGGKALLSPATMPSPNELAELPASVKARVRGGDLGGVSVVKNSTQAVGKGVPAFARGREIHVAPGQFKDPLLLHELAHVLQQDKGRGAAPKAPERGKLEAEADAAASAGFVDAAALSAAPEGEYHFEAFKSLINKFQLQGGSGQFVDVSFVLGVPVPQVPGLGVTVSAAGSFSQNSKGEKELSIDLSAGVEYKLGKLITVSGQFTESLKLTGNDLGAAFVDALKQSVFYCLKTLKVPEQLQELHGLAVNGPGFWDYAKCFIPIYGSYQSARVAIASFGADKVKAAYEGFMAFFKNDASVGFEASVGIGVGAEIAAGDRAGGITLAGKVGLEDVDKKDTKAFAEVSGEGVYRDKNNLVKIKIAKRWREGGSQTVSVGVTGQLSMQRFSGQSDGDSLIKDASLVWSLVQVTKALSAAKQGAKVAEIVNLSQSVLALSAKVAGGYSPGLDRLIGIDLSVEKNDGKWDKIGGKFKMMSQIGTGTGKRIEAAGVEVEANVAVGKYWDVTGSLSQALYGADAGKK